MAKRDLSNKQYVYIWADGVYTHVRQDDKLCLLVMIGSTQDGNKEAEKAYQTCIKKFEIKYPKAMHTLAKDKDEMLAFYQFPAEHWGHIRTL